MYFREGLKLFINKDDRARIGKEQDTYPPTSSPLIIPPCLKMPSSTVPVEEISRGVSMVLSALLIGRGRNGRACGKLGRELEIHGPEWLENLILDEKATVIERGFSWIGLGLGLGEVVIGCDELVRWKSEVAGEGRGASCMSCCADRARTLICNSRYLTCINY